jgi:hypothetical protein
VEAGIEESLLKVIIDIPEMYEINFNADVDCRILNIC